MDYLRRIGYTLIVNQIITSHTFLTSIPVYILITIFNKIFSANLKFMKILFTNNFIKKYILDQRLIFRQIDFNLLKFMQIHIRVKLIPTSTFIAPKGSKANNTTPISHLYTIHSIQSLNICKHTHIATLLTIIYYTIWNDQFYRQALI